MNLSQPGVRYGRNCGHKSVLRFFGPVSNLQLPKYHEMFLDGCSSVPCSMCKSRILRCFLSFGEKLQHSYYSRWAVQARVMRMCIVQCMLLLSSRYLVKCSRCNDCTVAAFVTGR